jgi:hypothetical protein
VKAVESVTHRLAPLQESVDRIGQGSHLHDGLPPHLTLAEQADDGMARRWMDTADPAPTGRPTDCLLAQRDSAGCLLQNEGSPN